MIYYRRNKIYLEEFQNKEDRELLLYPEKENILNYAFTILYGKEEKMEQVIRTSDLKNHYLAMRLLYTKSKYLKKYVTKKEANTVILIECMESLVKNGNTIIYNELPFPKEEQGGLLYLPQEYSGWMKAYLKDHYPYLTKFPDMEIYQWKGQCIPIRNTSSDFRDVLKHILK